MRRVKCDEGKPACQRCLTFGMGCLGYRTPSRAAKQQQPPLQKTLLPHVPHPIQSLPTPPSEFSSSGGKIRTNYVGDKAFELPRPSNTATSFQRLHRLQPRGKKSRNRRPGLVGSETSNESQEDEDLFSHNSATGNSSSSGSSPSSQKGSQVQILSPYLGKPGSTPEARYIPLIRPPSTSIFDTEDEHRYFKFFSDRTVAHIAGCYNPLLWNQSVLQACEGERSILYAAIAIGALDLFFRTGRSHVELDPTIPNDDAAAHYRFSLQQMNKAIKQMRETVQKKQDLRTTLLASILIIAFEIYHGNHESALDQIRSSVQLLEDWTAPYNCTLDTAALSPSPHTVEDDLVHAFYRLEIEGMVYIDKLPVQCHLSRKDDRASTVEKMPFAFSTISEAQIFGKILMRRVIHFLIVAWTYDPETVQEPDKSLYVLDKIRCRATEESLAERERYRDELARWYKAFTPLLSRATASPEARDRYSAICLQVHYLCTCIAIDCLFRPSEMFFDTLKPQLIEVLTLTKILLDHEDDSFFVFDSQVILPLEIVARKCRDPGVRREAIRLMEGVKRREGFMDSLVLARVCRWLVGIEEEGMLGRFIPEEARVRDVRAEPGEKGEMRVWCEMPKVGGKVGEMDVRETFINVHL
jgi:hypothetical protein